MKRVASESKNLRSNFFVRCVQRSWTTLAGVSPVTVIASEPCSQTRCVAVMQGAKRVGKVTSKEVQAIMQTATLSEFCRIVKKGL